MDVVLKQILMVYSLEVLLTDPVRRLKWSLDAGTKLPLPFGA